MSPMTSTSNDSFYLKALRGIRSRVISKGRVGKMPTQEGLLPLSVP